MSVKLKKKRLEKLNVRLICLVKELCPPHIFFLHGDVPLDLDFKGMKGMMFCENNPLAGLKTCRCVQKTKNFIHFDLTNESQQINNFQFLIDRIQGIQAEGVNDLVFELQKYQAHINAEKALEIEFHIQEKLDAMITQDSNIPDLESIFKRANIILEDKITHETPFIHYQIYRKTANQFSSMRSGISVPGLKQFAINIDIFEQSMLRKNHLPINRDEIGLLVALRSLKKLNINYAEHAKSGIPIISHATIKVADTNFTIEESSRFYALFDFIHESSDSNYYLIIHSLRFLKQEPIQSSKGQSSMIFMGSNKKRKQVPLPLVKEPSIYSDDFIKIPKNHDLSLNSGQHPDLNQNQNQTCIQINKNDKPIQQFLETFDGEQGNQMYEENILPFTNINTNYIDDLSNINFTIHDYELDMNDLLINDPRKPEHPQNETILKNDNINYNKKEALTGYIDNANEFIKSFYDSKESEIKKQQQFDKSLQKMLIKKQKKLNVQLL